MTVVGNGWRCATCARGGVVALAALRRPAAAGATFKAGTQVVSLFVTVADAQKRLVPGPDEGRLRGLRQREAAADRLLRQQHPPDQRRRHARHQRQHDADHRSAEAGGGAVPDPAAARRQGARSARSTTRSSSTRAGRNNRDQLITDVKNLDYGNGTRLWDAVGASLDELKGIDGRQGDPGLHRRRRHRRARSGWARVIDRARAEEVMVYAIGLESKYFDGQRRSSKPDGGLRKIADETGGGYFELKKTSRPRADVHESGAGAAQPVRDRLHADAARQQGPQAGGEDEAAGHDGAGAPQLPGRRRQDVGVRKVARARHACSCRAGLDERAATIATTSNTPTTHSADAEKLHSRIRSLSPALPSQVRRLRPRQRFNRAMTSLSEQEFRVKSDEALECRTPCAAAAGGQRRLRSRAAERRAEPRVRGAGETEIRRLAECAGAADLGVGDGEKL